MQKFIVALILMFTVVACAKPTTVSPYLDKQDVKKETIIQKKIAKKHSVDLKKKPITKTEMKKMVARLKKHSKRVIKAGQKLCYNMRRNPKECIYDFKIKHADNLNAYADGKSIFVTPIMMRFAKDDTTLGMVLSHEYAHNIMGHVNNKQKNMSIGMIGGLLLDIAASSQGYNTGGKLTNLGASIGGRAFSPEFESEADYVGMYIMALAKYDITKASVLWRNMTAADPRGAFMNGTHPANPKRFVLLEKTKDEILYKLKHKIILTPNMRLAK